MKRVLSERVKDARSQRKMSQMELAKAAGVSQSTVSKLERGGFNDEPNDKAIRAVLNLLDLTPADTSEYTFNSLPDVELAVEEAAGAAMVSGKHLPRDATSVAHAASLTVRELLGNALDTDQGKALLRDCAAAWLDAAADLRERNVVPDAASLLVQVTLNLTKRLRERA